MSEGTTVTPDKLPWRTMMQFVGGLMQGWSGPWGVAGGWAVDALVGEVTRAHRDIDISILRGDAEHLPARLSGWTIGLAAGAEILPWHGGAVEAPLHELHAVSPSGHKVEFLLSDHVGETWLFRRDHAVSRPLRQAYIRKAGLPVLAPEIVLLFKAKAPQPPDEADFALLLPTLSAERRAWLRAALQRCLAGHSWLTRL